MDTLFIGIAGGSASGKTTLVRLLKERCHTGITVISHDSYYKAHNGLTLEERSKLNYDEPDAFENSLLIDHLNELRRGNSVEVPVYDYSLHNRSNDSYTVHPCPVIIVEGILLFASEELCNMLDVKIFVDVDPDIRLIRRILRDVKERGRSLDSVIDQYVSTVKPMHEKYVEPSKKMAQLVVTDGGENAAALDLLVYRIDHHINCSL